jgi:hypothetical protein
VANIRGSSGALSPGFFGDYLAGSLGGFILVKVKAKQNNFLFCSGSGSGSRQNRQHNQPPRASKPKRRRGIAAAPASLPACQPSGE